MGIAAANFEKGRHARARVKKKGLATRDYIAIVI